MGQSYEDTLLINLLQQQSPKALKYFYEKYWKRMFVYAHKIIDNQQTCEDIVQEIFISLWKKAPETDIRNIEAYLFQALRYKISNAIRNSKYIELRDDILEDLPTSNNIKDHVYYLDLENQVLKTMESLPQKCRNVFYLSRIKNYNNQEIAQQLNISVRTVENHINKALKHFKFHLQEYSIYGGIILLVYYILQPSFL
ncbi:RNA polymerase sigma-70 factor, ECF subfamily [Zhouia amylolytica]|uniref:RNA polymerase sigma-70 factor, ECF subfamily n=1 Tax=Zhouia amylolytica TaxID=376730 RepID=A0A1I6TF52_9FLAO|nr:RNA polymerase sigma-70 factor [Zhouia amylolytica]MCQ0112178.1 RNA polymerase sigma-70 factor [Zhouia amylolytica]SFS87738.1 RNA polymerase sigma-70 factor, ECF subfamily [Zhouia amylolytica]